MNNKLIVAIVMMLRHDLKSDFDRYRALMCAEFAEHLCRECGVDPEASLFIVDRDTDEITS